MIRQLSFAVIFLCVAAGNVCGSLHVYVSQEDSADGNESMVVSASVDVFQLLGSDPNCIKVKYSGWTGEKGEPYTPGIKLPKATFYIRARKSGKTGQKTIDYDGIAESPTNVVVPLNEERVVLSLPDRFEIGDCFVLRKTVKYVYETRGACTYYTYPDGTCHSQPFTTSICRPVYCDEWVRLPRGEAKLTVSVPEGAEVFINGRPTTSTGAERVYLSQGLAKDVDYWYLVQVRITRNGKVLEKVQRVVLRAGESKTVSVHFSN